MATKTEIVFSLLIFFALLSTIMGFIGNELQENIEEEHGVEDNDVFANTIGRTVFGNVVYGYASLPVWINIVLFGSIGILCIWLILSSLPTVSGGS